MGLSGRSMSTVNFSASFSKTRAPQLQVLTVSFVAILLFPSWSSISSVSAFTTPNPSSGVTKKCENHCDSNRPHGENGPYTLKCVTNRAANTDIGTQAPSVVLEECDDKTCHKLMCPGEICSDGTVHCPAINNSALEMRTSAFSPDRTDNNVQARSLDGPESSGGFDGPGGIPVWFWAVFGIIIVISCCSLICGFGNRQFYGQGYGEHYHYHSDGCGGGHYHHHRPDGCGGTYSDTHYGGGCGSGGYYHGGMGAYGYAPSMAYSAVPVAAVSTHTYYPPQTHMY